MYIVGSLRSFQKINKYLKESPERVFFRFTNSPKEKPLSDREEEISRGEEGVYYKITPFGLYAFPFKYFFFGKGIDSLSEFFYLLSKGVLEYSLKKGGNSSSTFISSRDVLARMGKGAALFAESYKYIRFMVISQDSKVWVLGKNDPWIDSSRMLDFYKAILEVEELPPLYELLPISIRSFSPIGPFLLFPYVMSSEVPRVFKLRGVMEPLWSAFESILALSLRNLNQYRKNLEASLKKLLLSEEVENYEFLSYLEWLGELSESDKSSIRSGRYAKVQNLPSILPFTSYIISFYLSRGDILRNKDAIGDIYFGLEVIEKLMGDRRFYLSLYSLFGYFNMVHIAPEISQLSTLEARKKFSEARRGLVEKVAKNLSTMSRGQVSYLRKLILSEVSKLFSSSLEKKLSPSKIVKLSLNKEHGGESKNFISLSEEIFLKYLLGFYITINPFFSFVSENEYEDSIAKKEREFLDNISGSSSSRPSYLQLHDKINDALNRPNGRYLRNVRKLILDLGFQVIVDPGYGLIHPNEPVQAVILDDSSLEYDDYFENFPYFYWRKLEELIKNLKSSLYKAKGKEDEAIDYSIDLAMHYMRMKGQGEEKVLQYLISLYLDFSFISKLLSSLGFGKEVQSLVKEKIISKIREVSEEMDPKVVRKVAINSFFNFFLDKIGKKDIPHQKVKKIFQEVKKVLGIKNHES